MTELKVLFEDKHLIVVIKPPTIGSQSDKNKDEDMSSILKDYLLKKNPSLKDAYLGIVHRLDRPVGGLMVFAKTEFANAKLSEEIRLKKFNKIYYTVVCGKPSKNEEELEDYLIQLRRINMSKVSLAENKNAKRAQLSYELLANLNSEEFGELSLLKVELKTGRHHQIRVQLANAGIPIWGDNKYNKTFVKKKTWTQIALWATKLSFKHPKEGKVLEFEVKPEDFPFSLFLKKA